MSSVTRNGRISWQGPRTTNGRGGNGSIKGIWDRVRARGNGDGLATSRGARKVDRFQIRGGRPTWLLVCSAEYRYLAVMEYEISLDERAGSAVRAAASADGAIVKLTLARSTRRAYQPGRQSRSTFRRSTAWLIMLKLSDSDDRKAWPWTILSVRFRSPGNLVEIHWYAFKKFATLKLYGHSPLVWCALNMRVSVCSCVGVRRDACYHGDSTRLLLTYCVRMTALLIK